MHGDITRVNYYVYNGQGLLQDYGEGERPDWWLNEVFNIKRNQAEGQ